MARERVGQGDPAVGALRVQPFLTAKGQLLEDFFFSLTHALEGTASVDIAG